MMNDAAHDVVVIGAGIVGLSVALQLHLEGLKVTVVDEHDPMQGCSAGNAGYLSQANIFPPATPDLLLKIPKLLLADDGPMVIRPSYLGKMVPWSLRAIAALRPAHYTKTIDTFASLITRSQPALDALAKQAQASDLMTREGGLIAYKTQAAFLGKQRSIPVWREHGVEVEVIGAGQLHDLEPALANDLVGGLFFSGSGRCSNPKALGLRYLDHLIHSGGRLLRGGVSKVSRNADQTWTVVVDGAAVITRRVVLCAGHRSEALLNGYGFKSALASERGYHLMLPESGVTLNRPIVFGEPLFAATPMQEGLRLAGTAEFCKPGAQPNMERAYMLERIASRYIPGLNATGAKPWTGIRPTLPDGLPAVGEVIPDSGYFYAFGHGHNGLMMSGITAQCIAALILKRPSPVDVLPLNLNRFK
jgi:glycine/D-amino acid oxidase-like deaminating enzyme